MSGSCSSPPAMPGMPLRSILHAAGSRVRIDRRHPRNGRPVRPSRRHVPQASRVFAGATVFRTSGRLGVKSVEIGSVVNGAIAGRRTVPCDALLMSGGYTPERASVLAVARQAGLGRRATGVPAGALSRARALGRVRAGASMASATYSTTARRRASPRRVRWAVTGSGIHGFGRDARIQHAWQARRPAATRHWTRRRAHSSISRTT